MMKFNQNDVNAKNEDSLRTLSRAITLSQGFFSLILARCNYQSLRQRLMEQLQERGTVKFKEIVLKPSARTLYTTIHAAVDDEQPSAVIVAGLELVSDLEGLLIATNHARDEFRKHFSFPVVLWVTDEVLQKFIRVAPDYTSWAATPIGFTIATSDLIEALHESAESVFEAILKTGSGKFLNNADLNLESGSRRRLELEAALRDLQNRGEVLNPELEADLQFLLGLDADTHDRMEKSRQYYERSLAFWLEQLRSQESGAVGGVRANNSNNQSISRGGFGSQFNQADNLLKAVKPAPIQNPPVQESEGVQAHELSQAGTSKSVREACALLKRCETQRNPPLNQDNLPNQKLYERVGCVLFYLGLWWRRYATVHRSEYRFACSQARDYFQQCIDVFEQGNRPDLMRQFINPLGGILQKLGEWDKLEAIAKLAVQLHQTYPEPIRLAYGYGLLAELALSQKAYKVAEIYADLALQTNAESSELACDLQHQYIDCGWSRAHYQNLYLLLLAQAKQHLGQVQEAIKILETAKVESKPQYDPSLYIRILNTLHSLYFSQRRYLEAFWIKQERSEIEYQYGFRAFIGAGQLRPRCQVTNPAIAPIEKLNTIAEEIAASGRQQDINRLIERISRTDCKLTVIHGPSGVGKSSLVTAGLVPALKQRAIGDRDALPIILRGYTNWINDLGQSLLRDLGTSLADALNEIRDINLAVSTDYPAFIISQLKKNADRNLLTVLIFDQIEEFFFVYTEPSTRCLLYTFLRDCLNIPYVKIILSLREDYLHYLLECERCTNLDIINNNILDKKIRYYLGNFSPDDAKAVIHSLNERSQFYLESPLIDELVKDLAKETGEIRPIELQVVGAQLHTEEIVSLEQYQQLDANPKQKLIERYLVEAIKDCGSQENQKIAQLVLYLLTEENNTRPLKSRIDLLTDLETAGLEIKDNQLDLVLDILVGSGIVLLVPESPADRYQLVHDYLVPFIRQQQGSDLLQALKREQQQRRLTQNRLNFFLRAAIVSMVAVLGFASLALQSESRRILAESERKRAEYAEIAALSSFSSALLLSDDQLGALVESVRVGKRMKALEQSWRTSNSNQEQVPADIKIRTLGNLNQTVYRVQEFNRIEQHQGTFISVTFLPDRNTFASVSSEGDIELWTLDGALIKHFKVSNFNKNLDRVNSWSFSPDGKTIASATADGTIKLWTLDGKLIKSFQGYNDSISSVSFSPNGTIIASAGTDKIGADGTVKLWTLDGTLLRTLKGHKDSVNSVNFSPDGNTIASAGTDKTIKIWKLDGSLLKTLQGHKDLVTSVSFSPNGKLIASASADKTVKLWRHDGTFLKDFYGHTDKVNSVIFSPDGQSLASASSDKTIKLWKLDGTLLKSLAGHTNWVRGVSFSPDGKTIASVSDDNTIKLWRFYNTELQTLRGQKE